MLRKVIFIVLWTVIFFFGSAIILGFCSGLLFAVLAGSGKEIPADGILIKVIGTS